MRFPLSAPLIALCALPALAQNADVRAVPRWIIGDRRLVTSTVTVHIETPDTVLPDVSATTVAKIAFNDARKDLYVLSVEMERHDDAADNLLVRVPGLRPAGQDTALRRVGANMEQLYAPLRKMETAFLVTHVGELTEMLDRDKERAALDKTMQDPVLDLIQLENGKQPRSPEALDAAVAHAIDSIYASFTATQTRILQRVLEVYALTFPEHGSVRQHAKPRIIDAPLMKDLGALLSNTEVGLDRLTPKELVGRVVSTFDATAVLQAINALDKDNKVKPDGLELKDETVYTVDRASGWPVSIGSMIALRSAPLRMRVSVNTTLAVMKP